MQNLASKYRPTTFDDVVGQASIKKILSQQLQTNTTKNAYLFVGSQGTGKTTCARIFAKEINKGLGNPIEMDAASNSGVDDVRNIIQQAQTKSLDSEYKVFIIDECHSISNTGWQAFLKLIEEPPAKSIFIFCTTNPEKVPKTILSRVQRFDFQRISIEGISIRLTDIYDIEIGIPTDKQDEIGASLEYIAKLADGGMRDAITLLDKCLSYSSELSMKNVIEALGTSDYDTMFSLYKAIQNKEANTVLLTIDNLYNEGKDLKQFIRNFMEFVLDINKYAIMQTYDYINIPSGIYDLNDCGDLYNVLLPTLMRLTNDIKWDKFPKPIIEIALIEVMK